MYAQSMTFWQYIEHHQTTIVLVTYWFYSNMVSALPSPTSYTSFYRFFFNLMHGLAGSIGRISPALRIPGANSAGADTNVTTVPNSASTPTPLAEEGNVHP